MKSVTEFQSHLLTRGVEAKTALLAEGKTPEEIQASIAESFKFEGDRLKHFLNSLDVAAKNTGLSRLVVVSLGEGETAPSKAVKVEEHYYLPEFRILSQPAPTGRDARGGRGGRQGGRGGPGGGRNSGNMKESPWGLSPEQKAAKKGAGKAASGGQK